MPRNQAADNIVGGGFRDLADIAERNIAALDDVADSKIMLPAVESKGIGGPT